MFIKIHKIFCRIGVRVKNSTLPGFLRTRHCTGGGAGLPEPDDASLKPSPVKEKRNNYRIGFKCKLVYNTLERELKEIVKYQKLQRYQICVQRHLYNPLMTTTNSVKMEVLSCP